jgi:hypothetical protein
MEAFISEIFRRTKRKEQDITNILLENFMKECFIIMKKMAKELIIISMATIKVCGKRGRRKEMVYSK